MSQLSYTPIFQRKPIISNNFSRYHKQKKYINFYTKIKENTLNESKELPPFPAFSVLIGQIGLKNVIDDNNYTISYASKLDNNNYFHLAGDVKYKNIDFDKDLLRLNKTLI